MRSGQREKGEKGRTTMHEGMGKRFSVFFGGGDFGLFKLVTVKGWEPFTFFFVQVVFYVFFEGMGNVSSWYIRADVL